MSGVRAAHSMSMTTPLMPSQADNGVQAMQDVLYDILANGMDPDRSEVPVQEVERFLFEHARSPKSRDEFRAFFAEHGLTLRMNIAPAPVGLSLPPIERAAPPPQDRGMPARVPVELALGASAAVQPFQLDSSTLEVVNTPRRSRRAAVGVTLASLCVVALLAGAGYYGYTTIIELRGELERTAQHGRSNEVALKALRDHAAGLESSVAATGELVQRMDQKSDLLIDSLLPDDKTKSRKRR
jgi:hypothetical protein